MGTKKAFRRLADVVNGRLSRDSGVEQATITLPDYGSCQLVLRIMSE